MKRIVLGLICATVLLASVIVATRPSSVPFNVVGYRSYIVESADLVDATFVITENTDKDVDFAAFRELARQANARGKALKITVCFNYVATIMVEAMPCETVLIIHPATILSRR